MASYHGQPVSANSGCEQNRLQKTVGPFVNPSQARDSSLYYSLRAHADGIGEQLQRALCSSLGNATLVMSLLSSAGGSCFHRMAIESVPFDRGSTGSACRTDLWEQALPRVIRCPLRWATMRVQTRLLSARRQIRTDHNRTISSCRRAVTPCSG